MNFFNEVVRLLENKQPISDSEFTDVEKTQKYLESITKIIEDFGKSNGKHLILEERNFSVDKEQHIYGESASFLIVPGNISICIQSRKAGDMVDGLNPHSVHYNPIELIISVSIGHVRNRLRWSQKNKHFELLNNTPGLSIIMSRVTNKLGEAMQQASGAMCSAEAEGDQFAKNTQEGNVISVVEDYLTEQIGPNYAELFEKLFEAGNMSREHFY